MSENKKHQKPAEQLLYTSREAADGEEQARMAIEKAIKNVTKEQLDEKYSGLSTSAESQAAIYFAAGQFKMGIDSLVKKVNETKGQAPINTWYMLLDGYEIDNNRNSHEKLSEYFAKRFQMSAPQFHEYTQDSSAGGQMFGRNVLKVEDSPTELSIEKEKDFLSAAKENKNCKIDLSRAIITIDKTGAEGCQVICRILAQLRRYKIDSILMGDISIANNLKNFLKEPVKAKSQDSKPFWQLYMEILQWRQNEEEFEKWALEFAMAFSESPPSFEKSNSTAIGQSGSNIVVPDKHILNLNNLKKEIQGKLYATGKIEIDFKHVKRITIECANEFKDFLGKSGVAKKNIFFYEPNQIVLTILQMTGINDIAEFTTKQR